MGKTTVSKVFLHLQVCSSMYNFVERKKSSIDWIKTATIERCNTFTLYHSVKGIIPEILNNI